MLVSLMKRRDIYYRKIVISIVSEIFPYAVYFTDKFSFPSFKASTLHWLTNRRDIVPLTSIK
jgi:hypothetical protein